MKLYIAIIFSSMLLYAQTAQSEITFDKKLNITKSIWASAFNKIKYKTVKDQYIKYRKSKNLPGAGGLISESQFLRSKELMSEALAETLDIEDLELQKRLFKTAVGSVILSNIPRGFGGLAPIRPTQDAFTKSEWNEFTKFAAKEQQNVRNMQTKMKGFSALMKEKRKKLMSGN